MKCLNKCCCCVKLRMGCFIIAALYFLNTLSGIAMNLSLFEAVSVPDENEDKENREQREFVRTLIIVRLLIDVIYLIFVIVLIYGTHAENVNLLKGCAIFFIAGSTIHLIVAVLDFAVGYLPVPIALINMLFATYFGIVVWSYAEEIDEEERVMEMGYTPSTPGGRDVYPTQSFPYPGYNVYPYSNNQGQPSANPGFQGYGYGYPVQPNPSAGNIGRPVSYTYPTGQPAAYPYPYSSTTGHPTSYTYPSSATTSQPTSYPYPSSATGGRKIAYPYPSGPTNQPPAFPNPSAPPDPDMDKTNTKEEDPTSSSWFRSR